MKKKLWGLLLSMVLVIGMVSQAMAVNRAESTHLPPLEYIQSEEVSSRIAENIALAETGTQSIYVGNGIMFTATVRTTTNPRLLKASNPTKTGEANGRFYTISDNETVAEYSLSATFEYDRNNYVGLVNSPTLTNETVDENWRLDDVCEQLQTDTQYIVSGQWTLYHKEGVIWKKYEYNNNTHIDIICTPKGVITYNYK